MRDGFSGLQLAFIGDAVFSLMVREKLLKEAKRPVGELHALAERFVRARAQAEYYYALEPGLTDEERAVMKSGRNANIRSRAKNAAMTDYRHATGFEALFGWLYITGRAARLSELFNICVGDDDE